MEEYGGRQYVGIDLHRRRSVIVRMTPEGQRLEVPVRIDNDPLELARQVASWGESPEVVLEATYGWYWAADVLADAGAVVHLAHPLGIKGFNYRRVKNDERDAADLADLLRMGRLPEAWIAPPEVRGLREAVRHRCKLVALRSGLKAQVHAVLAKQGVRVAMSDLFGVGGQKMLDELRLDAPFNARVASLRRLIDAFNFEIDILARRTDLRRAFLGALASAQRDGEAAEQFLSMGLELYEQLGHEPGIAAALNALAISARDRGDYPLAQARFERSLACWRLLSDHIAIARCLHNLATVVKVRGDYTRAIWALEEASEIFERLGDRSGAAW